MATPPPVHYPYRPSPYNTSHPVIFHTPNTPPPPLPNIFSDSTRHDSHDFTFSPNSPLYPRPQHWRPSFPNKLAPFPNFLARLGPTRIDPLLRVRYSRNLPHIRYDLRYHLPPDPRFSLPASHRIPCSDDLQHPVTTPALSYLPLWHRRLPWYIDITASHPRKGVTIADVLSQLSTALAQPVYNSEYWTTALTEEDRNTILKTFRVRQVLLGPRDHKASGRPPICRVDYLRQDVIFAGLSPSADGTFEIRTIPFI